MEFDTKIVLQQSTTDKYWYAVLNPDGSLIWAPSIYTILAYYDNTDENYNYTYFAEAEPWTWVNEAKWRCFRIQEDKEWKFISKRYAWLLFNNKWDETTVKWLTYN